MKKNVGVVDKLVRFILAAVILAAILTGAIQGMVAVVLGVVAIILFGTGLIGWCGIYTLLGISTAGCAVCDVRKQ